MPKHQWTIFTNAVFFVLGFSIVFSLVGVLLQSVLAGISYSVQKWLGYAGGAMIIFFGIYLLGLVKMLLFAPKKMWWLVKRLKFIISLRRNGILTNTEN